MKQARMLCMDEGMHTLTFSEPPDSSVGIVSSLPITAQHLISYNTTVIRL